MIDCDWQASPWWRHFWLGPVQIPPLAAQFGMTDRDGSGNVWYPSVTADGKHIQFTNVAPTSAPIKIFGAFDGPFVGQSSLRMGISTGHVVVDRFPDTGPGPFVRGGNALAAVFFALTKGPSKDSFDHLGFQSDAVQGGIFDPTP